MRQTSAAVWRAMTRGILLCGLITGAWAQTAASDVRVSATRIRARSGPAVATDANANFVVVWEGVGVYGEPVGIFARRFDGVATPFGPEFQVNSYITDIHGAPAVAMRPSGEFVVAWQSVAPGERFGRVLARLFDASGNALGSEFPIEAGATNTQRSPALAMEDTGHFVLVWQGYDSGGLSDVRARRFDAVGNPVGADFVVNTYTTDHQGGPRVAVDSTGNFVVVWESYQLSPGGGAVNRTCCFARRFDASGNPNGPEFPVTEQTSGARRPRVAMGPDGTFMAVWEHGSCCEDNIAGGIRARIFDPSGLPVGPELRMENASVLVPPNNRVQSVEPSVSADEAGTFVVAWHRSFLRVSYKDFGYYQHHIRMRRFDASGSALDPGSAANTFWHPNAHKSDPAVAARMADRFIVVWNGHHQYRNDVFARSPDVIFSDGFES